MYIDNDDFEKWMERLSQKLNDIGKDLKSFVNTSNIGSVFPEDEKLLDNQDLAFLLKVSKRTLQRYQSSRELSHFMVNHKTYYRVNDMQEFVRSYMYPQIWREFEKQHPKENKDG